jgi:hypothetical protein
MLKYSAALSFASAVQGPAQRFRVETSEARSQGLKDKRSDKTVSGQTE